MKLSWLLPALALSAVTFTAAAAEQLWQAAGEFCKDQHQHGPGLFQTSLARRHARSKPENPLDKRVYVTCTSHKAGSQLLRNTMRWILDLLGAREGCRYDHMGQEFLTHGVWDQECSEHPANVRFHNHISGKALLELRAETAQTGGFRGVMTIRNPLEMVISSYCYHHRGAEPWNSISDGMASMHPKDGVPEMARRMLPVVYNMVQAYQVTKPEVYVSRFERMTGSSTGFNQTVQEMLDFLFGNEVSDNFKRRALDAAVHEDLNRGEFGYSFTDHTNDVNHTSDEQEMDEARSYLSLVDKDLMAHYKEMQKALGYSTE
ncbi:Copia protein [Durusdinium trenchii]|uniref:Copia protein n=1 Tax=Durusdinium trenchii TaxID=1381693 RepID=A0ABP0PXQ3_9DINO